MSIEEEVLDKIKFVLNSNNEAQAIRILEDYGFNKLEQGKQLNIHTVVQANPEEKDWMTPEDRENYELMKRCGFDCK